MSDLALTIPPDSALAESSQQRETYLFVLLPGDDERRQLVWSLGMALQYSYMCRIAGPFQIQLRPKGCYHLVYLVAA